MPYTQPIGPAAPGQVSIWDFFDDSVGVTSATPEEQAAAYSDLQSTDFSEPGGYQPAAQPPPSSNLSQWLKKNSTAVYAGTGILVLMAMFGGKRR